MSDGTPGDEKETPIGTDEGRPISNRLLERAVLDEREACAAILDADADRMEAVWEKHLASGVGGPATSFHTIARGYAQKIRNRSNARVSGAGHETK